MLPRDEVDDHVVSGVAARGGDRDGRPGLEEVIGRPSLRAFQMLAVISEARASWSTLHLML